MPMPTVPHGTATKHGVVVLAAALLVGSGGAPQAAPGATENLRAQVTSLLARPDAFPPDEEDWKPLGPAALGVLEELASDPKLPHPEQARAVASMAAVEHPQATARLSAFLANTRAQAPLRASAAAALGLRLGSEAVSTLLPLLRDRNARVREASARALGRLGGLQVQQALEDRLSLEEDPLVREALQQGLTFAEP